jgi:DNA-binding protein HU-beta
MTKKELLKAISEKTGITQKEVDAVLDAFVEVTKEALKKEDYVALPDFGKFEVVERAARNGVNPQTKEQIVIPAHKAVKFKASKTLKELF